MSKRDPKVDAYVKRAPEFARPILEHMRDIVHLACPEIVETIKWGRPFFDHRGPVCGLAAFKAHCSVMFWKADVLFTPDEQRDGGLGQFARLVSVKDLPAKRELIALVKRAVLLNQDGVSAKWQEARKKTRATRAATPVVLPALLTEALATDAKAREAFDAMPPGHKREYAEWIDGAKREETRQRRTAQAVAQIREGKAQNWRYESRG
jgi:hypothetical protein